MKMARKQCRVWWPKQLLHNKPSSNLLLFGWCMHSFNSLDIVLAFATSTNEILVNLLKQDFQGILSDVDAKMPVALQKSSTFSILGICIFESGTQSVKIMSSQDFGSFPKSKRVNRHSLDLEDNAASSSTFKGPMHSYSIQKSFVRKTSAGDCGRYRCGCEKLNISVDAQRKDLIKCGIWIQLYSRLLGSSYKEARWIPEFDHIHQNGDILPITNFHLIMYDPPAYSRHHYTLSSWTAINQREPFPDLEAVVLALNCSDAAMQHLNKYLFAKVPTTRRSLCWLVSKLWHMLAILFATVSAVVYITFQLLYAVLNSRYCKLSTLILKKTFGHTWKNVHIRACQFVYWPIFLLGSGLSSHSNTEFAHKDALRKHHMWSSVAVDLFLGVVYGLTIFTNVEVVCFWINFVARGITDNLLRSGCVWLMGVPAGFKLNTELAEFFGMISLDAIQTFSTLWLFIGSFLQHFIKGIAISGILFGLTVPSALCIDMLRLVTLHAVTLHWLISFVYSHQIQALASLWRLFRGRKWNPIRQRLDSYDDYSAEQHVVGSLLFTPLLLLLPTTSVFYIFFTLLSTSLILIRLMIEITISALHATPYAEILLWFVRRKRFTSGIWFEIVTGTILHSPSHGMPHVGHMTSDSVGRDFSGLQGTTVSILHNNYATLGQLVSPCYSRVFGKVNPAFSKQLASGILSGQRSPSCLDTYLPATMPWLQLSFRAYWRLCYYSIVGSSL